MNPLELIQKRMIQDNVDFYIIDTCDPHCSEYINDYYKLRQHYSGFTGSNGLLLVMQQSAFLWTDGRYFVQAAAELYDGIKLMKIGEKNVPAFSVFIAKNLKKNQTIAFNGNLLSTAKGIMLQDIANKKKARIIYDYCLADSLWTDRPLNSMSKAYILEDKYTGESAVSKIRRCRTCMKNNGNDGLFISKLDEIMWLTNLRGSDIEYNPVLYSYAFMDKNQFILFINLKSLTKKIKDYLKENNILVKDYSDTENIIRDILKNNKYHKIATDFRYLTMNYYRLFQEYTELSDTASPADLFKAIKNRTELKNSIECYIKDSAVVTRYIKYLKENKRNNLTETSAARVLDDMRSKLPGFKGLSFTTISAYGPNAAMMHYEAIEGKDAVIKPEGLYLVDSGGQYYTGTTDVTRTVVMGSLTDKCRMHYTLSVVAMLRLMNTVFIKGVTGRNLDGIAREPLWQIGSDYKCGTGHGIGYFLNVHEGPHNISYHKRPGIEEALREGMIVSDEPGVYLEGQYGIRIETILYVKKKCTTSDGEFLCFKPLTFVPVDLEGIDTKYMNSNDIKLLNDYHHEVYKKLRPLFSEEEQRWLKNITKPI